MLEWNPQALLNTLLENKPEDLLVFFGNALIKVDKGRVLSHLSNTLMLSGFDLPATRCGGCPEDHDFPSCNHLKFMSRRPLHKWICVAREWVCFDKGWFPFWDCVRLFVIRSRSDVAFPRHLSQVGMNSFDTVKPYIPPDKELSPSPIDVKSPPTHDLEFYVDDHTAIFLVSGHCPAVRVWQNDDDTTR